MDWSRQFDRLYLLLKEQGNEAALAILQRSLDRNLDGGPGSGHWGHAGRKGVKGGSAPGGGKQYRIRNSTRHGFSSRAKLLKELKPPPDQRVKYHLIQKGELEQLGMNVPVRIRGIKETFYRNSKGLLEGVESGTSYHEIVLMGNEISYRIPRCGNPTRSEPEIRKLYRDGILDPHDVVEAAEMLQPGDDGKEILASNGKTYRANNGHWEEVGPCGVIRDPKDAPVSRQGWIEGTVRGDLYDFTLGGAGLNQEAVRNVSEIMKTCPKPLKDSYTRALAGNPPDVSDKRDLNAFYEPGSDTVCLNVRNAARTVLHEYAHMIDATSGKFALPGGGMSLKLQTAITESMRMEDRETVARISGIGTDGQGRILGSASARCSAGERLASKIPKESGDKAGFAAAMDIVSSVTENALNELANGGGHSQDYWYKPSPSRNMGERIFSEPVADYLAIRAMNDTAAIDALHQIAPNLMRELDNLYQESFS